MQKVIVLFYALIIWMFSTSFVSPPEDKVKWLTVAELQDIYYKEPRPILIDIYTKWCGWCKVMDKETYNNDSVANYINQHYYAVKFDAEIKDTIHWAGKSFIYNEQYRVNEFSVYISGGQAGYPTTVLLANINAQPAPLSGFYKPSEIEGPLRYFGDGIYKLKNYPDFIKGLSVTWK